MRQGLIPYITGHAADKFRRRSGQRELDRNEARANIRYLIETGEEGTRNNDEGLPQPVVRSQGWVFVLSFDLQAVVTVFCG